MKVFVLISDVGLNGHVVHGVFDAPPSSTVVAEAEKSGRGWTGYSATTVVEQELNRALPCGGECTRLPVRGTSWSSCHCYVNGLSGRPTKGDAA